MGKTFKENLKELLEYHDMTMKELAYLTSISHRSIENYLNSRESIPPADYACKIAKALNTSVEYLVTGSDPTYKKYEYPGDLLKIIEVYTKLAPTDQKILSDLMLSLSRK